MTEKYIWTPKDPDKEPHANISIGDKLEFEATRQNSSIWHFLGNIAVFNCIQMDHIDDDDDTLVMFSFAPHYKKLFDYMHKHAYPIHANQAEVPESIVDAYYRTMYHDLSDVDNIVEKWGEQK